MRDGFAEVNGQRVSPDVARLRPVGIGENGLDRLKDRGPGLTVAKVIKHHRSAPDLPDRVGNSFAGDVRSTSVNGFEHARKFTFRVEVSRGSNADGAGYCGTKIAEYIAEEVRCDDDIKPVGVQDKVRREDVNVELVYFYIGVLRRDGLHPFVPIRHGNRNPVALGGARQVLFGSALRQLKGVVKYGIDPRRVKIVS